MKKLKLWNGRSWLNGGYLYVCAHSQTHAIQITNEAYRIIHGREDCPNINPVRMYDLRNYWSAGCWGIPMDGITPEIGVWHQETWQSRPIRIYPSKRRSYLMAGKRKGKSFKYHPIKWDPAVFDQIEEAVRNGNWEDPTKFIKEAVGDKLDKLNKSDFLNHKTIRNLKGEIVAEVFYD